MQALDPLEALADALAARGLNTKFIEDANSDPGACLLVRSRNTPSIGDTIQLLDGCLTDSTGADLGSPDQVESIALVVAYRMATKERIADYIRANQPAQVTA